MAQPTFSQREKAVIAAATIACVVLSAAVHFTLGAAVEPFLMHRAAPAADQTLTPIEVVRFVHPTPTPTPVPTPTPPPPRDHPRVTPSARPSAPPNPVHVIPIARSSPQPGHGESPPPLPQNNQSPLPQADASASPAASDSPKPDSGQPKQIAPGGFKHRVVPEYPQICVEQGAAGRTVIDVTIGSDGAVAAVWVGQTSGFACLDAAALAAAKESTYNPPEVDGRPVTETYLIVYEFSIDS